MKKSFNPQNTAVLRILAIAAFILKTAVLPIASEPLDQDNEAFKILIAEQEQAIDLRTQPKKFRTMRTDFFAFRQSAIEVFRQQHSEQFKRNELKELTKALKSYREDRKQRRRSRQPMFQTFHGDWRGLWQQPGMRKTFDHSWDQPFIRNGLVIQLVEIGEWNGSRRINPTPAINTFDPETGFISGAVGISSENTEYGTKAPHWGIYINESTLIWIAGFENDSPLPYYSIYYEQIIKEEPVQYKIRGIGFHWDSSQPQKGLIDPHWKEGLYSKIEPCKN